LGKAIRFEGVSKRYNLGLTRTSLPTKMSGWLNEKIRRIPRKSYDDKYLWALKDISFELENGQAIALIGANGAGKTTILKVLANITKPTTGSIEINGRLSALIALGAGFHPDLTGRENIFLNGTILGLRRKEIERKFDEIVAFSELERFIDTPVKRYSSGMHVRLGFSIAASIEPTILLVDEVLAVGDASFRQKSLERIHELLDKGVSVIFVSHNLWLVQAVCTKAIYLEKGRLKHMGETSEVVAMYDHDIHEERARKLVRGEQKSNQGQSGDLEINAVIIVAEEGGTGDFENNKQAVIRIDYTAFRNIGSANVVARIVRSDGVTACMMRTSLDGFPLSLERGSGIISITLEPLQLYGGSYYVQTIIRDDSDSFTLASQISDWFYVNGSVLSHQEMNGVYEPMRRWSHQPLLESSVVTAQ
jgi:lipopolysaccharide transport system ATP-binding protein